LRRRGPAAWPRRRATSRRSRTQARALLVSLDPRVELRRAFRLARSHGSSERPCSDRWHPRPHVRPWDRPQRHRSLPIQAPRARRPTSRQTGDTESTLNFDACVSLFATFAASRPPDSRPARSSLCPCLGISAGKSGAFSLLKEVPSTKLCRSRAAASAPHVEVSASCIAATRKHCSPMTQIAASFTS